MFLIPDLINSRRNVPILVLILYHNHRTQDPLNTIYSHNTNPYPFASPAPPSYFPQLGTDA